MIVSVSRRTDIPAFYGDWFAKRLSEGYVLTRNPFNRKQVSKIILSEETVDCFVFWTKDPRPFIKHIAKLEAYKYYFQITITPYGKNIEPFLENKDDIIKCVSNLSKTIGKEKIIWRYDPILINDEYTVDSHFTHFEKMCVKFEGIIDKCIISFIDDYREVRRNMNKLRLKLITFEDISRIAERFSILARKHNIKIETCAEKVDLSTLEIEHASCVDPKLISKITGKTEKNFRPDNIRDGCGCAKSVDIGEYNSCQHRCAYCYANYNSALIQKNHISSDPDSSLLIGHLEGNEKITVHTLCRNTASRLKKGGYYFETE